MSTVGATPVSRALWYIESHFRRELTLEEIADAGCVSRYHMSRVFAVTMGCPIMRYVRARRLTEAARSLVDGATQILNVALDAGYGSHEAFTRAFHEQFWHHTGGGKGPRTSSKCPCNGADENARTALGKA